MTSLQLALSFFEGHPVWVLRESLSVAHTVLLPQRWCRGCFSLWQKPLPLPFVRQPKRPSVHFSSLQQVQLYYEKPTKSIPSHLYLLDKVFLRELFFPIKRHFFWGAQKCFLCPGRFKFPFQISNYLFQKLKVYLHFKRWNQPHIWIPKEVSSRFQI